MTQIDPTAIRQGDRLALTRALTLIENNTSESEEILSDLFPFSGNAHIVGITGAPGTGKSTLVFQLAKLIRKKIDHLSAPKVAIISVDPTSPFSGGSLLGDRIRMQELTNDKGIFMRSMASRGALGGLSHRTAAFAHVLDAAGYEMILIETVGAGQDEINIVSLAHTVIVTEAPGFGDDIQAIKAGILEIADIFVVNKADRPGADTLARSLKFMLEMNMKKGDNKITNKGKHQSETQLSSTNINQHPPIDTWTVPVLKTTANEGKGINKLVELIFQHQAFLKTTNNWQVKESNQLKHEFEALLKEMVLNQWFHERDEDKFDALLNQVIHKQTSPIKAAKLLLSIHDVTAQLKKNNKI